jgi:hypothetical protein
MTVMRLRVAAAIAVSVVVSPVAAASASSVATSPSLHLRLPLQLTLAKARGTRSGTCQATRSDGRTAAKTALVGDDRRRIGIVACEQPPRSQLTLPPALNHAVTSAIAVIG